MTTSIELLSRVSLTIALLAGACYIYGYIIRARGKRRWHTASLLFSALAMANLPVVLTHGAQDEGLFSGAAMVLFLGLSTLCQALTALRGRQGDRRAADGRDPQPQERRQDAMRAA